ncbi:probable membrane-bound lytic murein transglycosylase D precursor [Psychrobacter arcticus 273-4]|uniref:Probable membrane-bound lytic murein transglycosylase D n=1 Tax=Psychrobacter arcticus (strain DSM 17307 / VKM B-2377 / 273-4) TaxID=259536 RepID=Q4FS85_PSYA2|nr:LysM peptidoglycan-binding domain-containing protein [Psychrobacter arcticus]AAZ19123.1 probable membrane-bound lytic murein transglycosylase D precursor [Psychrobacter arcticus 273-4]
MSTVSSNYRSFIALPLTLAVSTLLISACSNTSAVKKTGATGSTALVNKHPATQVQSAGNADYSTAFLDAESLDELADLLEATDMTMVEGNKLAIQQYGDLWNRLRAGYRMNGGQPVYNQRIEAQKGWFTSRQDYLNRLTARASRYIYHTVREAERRNIPTELALLPVIESSYDPSGTSSAAAAGLWQFIPSTGRIYGLNQSSTYDGRRDVIESTRAAYDFLTALHNQFGSWELALAAYNAGPGRVQKAIDANRAQGLPTDYWSLRLPTETMNYVPRFLAVAEIVAKPEKYGVYLPAIANRQHFRSVPVNYGVSLAEVSQVTGVSYDELERLNTALTSARIDSSGPQRIIIPNDVSLTTDVKLSALRGNGSSNILASSNAVTTTTPSYSGSTTPSYNNKPYTTSSSLPGTGKGLADYAASASVPQQTTSYIPPSSSMTSSSVYSSSASVRTEPLLTSAETKKINAELKSSNSLPTTSAQITQNNTIIQEPPLSKAERDFIANQIRINTPETNVINADGNINLSAVQTQQSILEASGQEKKLSFPKTSVSKPTPQGVRSTYTVKRGDTLSNIASRAGVSWRDITEWNQIDVSANLLSGSTLYLYNAKTIEPLSATSSTVASQPESYVVQGGDTLIGTANRFGLSVTQLASYNNLSSRADLLRGQKLWLIPGKVTAPVSTPAAPSTKPKKSSTATKNYKVKAGDGLIALARQFNITTETLASLNNIGTTDSLYVGQTLKVPASVDFTSSSAPTHTPSATSSNNTTTKASSSSSGPTTNYKVKSGDTLIGIANSVGVSAEDIAAVNSNFDAKARLQRGQTIKVPVSKELVDRQLNDEAVSYKIKSGDTLTGVAQRYNIGLGDLAAANNLKTSSNLILGRTITIPAKGSVNASDSAPATSNSGKKLGNTESYKVQSGDGLIALARRFDVSVEDLAATNDMTTKAQLQRGQTIKVPKLTVSYTVGSGDSLIGLARKYDVSTKELADMNNIAVDTMLQRGQRLTVPNR